MQLKTIALALPLLMLIGFAPVKADEMVIEKASPLGFEETIDKLKSNAKELGWKVPSKWNKDFQKI